MSQPLNLRELHRYLGRVGDRWPLAAVMIGGGRVEAWRATGGGGAPLTDLIVVLVSDAFDGIPWLERVYQASSLWDGLEMGGPADVHCYTPVEFARRRESTPAVIAVVERGLLLFEDTGPVDSEDAVRAQDAGPTPGAPPL